MNDLIRLSDLSELKVDQPAILSDFLAHESNCTHGLKKPVMVDMDSTSVHVCCLKCAVDFIFKERVNKKITVRSPIER
jgi:hypothetical protein